ncbi:unnamed protein product, partial [marine sediment metagenome]
PKQRKIKQALKNIFGLAYFAFAIEVRQEIGEIKEKCLALLQEEKFTSFKIFTKRSKKEFPLTSQQINEKIGAHIVEELDKKVDLTKPDLTCYVEIVEKYAFVYLKKIKGPGGLPVGVSGRAISLLSGGIDSPVASFYALKRGIRIIFLHFHSAPYTSEASITKVKKLAVILSKWQIRTKLYLVPFADIQKEILLKTPEKFRVVLYRRFMMRIAEQIALKEKALALVTGEAIGQVASQTIENIRAIEEAASLLILR